MPVARIRRTSPKFLFLKATSVDFSATSTRASLRETISLVGASTLSMAALPAKALARLVRAIRKILEIFCTRSSYVSFQKFLQKIFVMENVPNILAMRNGHYSNQIVKSFHKAGYSRTAIFTLLASHFGVPQDRRRVFFIGLRNGVQLGAAFEEVCTELLAKQKCKRPITVRQALSDLPRSVSENDGPLAYPKLRPGRCPDYQRLMRLDCDTSLLTAAWKRARLNGDASLYNHHTKGIESRRQRIIQAIKPGMRGDSLPTQLWNGTRAHKWRRLHPLRPSYTILAHMHRDLSEWIHPEYDRWITVREAARLQSFHDGFVFHGSELQQLKQVGNAVPPLMALAIARAAAQLLEAVQGAE
jgi:DNA (cytosine-5)-methyltransferase 1